MSRVPVIASSAIAYDVQVFSQLNAYEKLMKIALCNRFTQNNEEDSVTRPSTIIDVHTHVIAEDTTAFPLAPLSGKQSDWSRDRPVSCEQMLAAMDTAGIAKMSLVQASTCYGHDNRYVADSVAERPDRFSGVFSVSMVEPDSIDRIKHWVDL